jgi:hypothetical protein
MIGFIGIATTIHYSAIANLPTSQITRTRPILLLILSVRFYTPAASELTIPNRLSLSNLGSNAIENVFLCRVLLRYLATRCSMVHREHSASYYVFFGTCILSRCLAMGRYVTIPLC